MRVYLIAAPEDQEEAEKLAAYLKRFGVFIRSEYGNFAYPPAHYGEFTLALWSRSAMMSTRQMMLTNRAIDAWAEGQLVMARLEHGLNPRGLSDLDMVDLTFAAAREHRYRDVLNALRALQDAQRREAAAAAPPPPSSSSGPGGDIPIMGSHDHYALDSDVEPDGSVKGDLDDGSLDALDDEIEAMSQEKALDLEPPVSPAPSPARSAPLPTKRAGFPRVLFAMVALIAIAVVTFLALPDLQQASENPSGSIDLFVDWVMSPLGLGIIGAFLLLILLFVGLGLARRPNRKPNEVEAAPPSRRVVIPEPAERKEIATAEVFVSYAHANADTVIPIVESVEQKGLTIWIDREEMRAGQGWAGQIVRAIKSAEQFCIMCSAQSFASDHVRREVYLADKYGKKLVPVRLDGAEMPEDIEYFLISQQWVDLSEFPESEHAGAVHRALQIDEG